MSFYLRNDDDDMNHQTPQSGSNSPSVVLNNSQKQNSLRNTKLARRARSFKDDVIGTILKVRSPNINTLSLGRSHSPNSPRNKLSKGNHSLCSTDGGDSNHKPLHDLNYHVRQVKNALQHFKGVISRNRLEVLPANGTVVLETIANVHTALQPYTLNENSSAIISATTQVYLSLGKLIKLCDEVLLSEDDANCASLSQENVTEVVELVEKAVQNLVQLANDKMTEREKNGGTTKPNTSSNTLQRPEVNTQRTSLPDIPLTPRERDILEQSQTKNLRTSHSIESILRDSSPPPKPPLPERSSNPPPLPPKRKIQPKPIGIQLSSQLQTQSVTDLDISNNIDSTLLNCGLDRMSLRSKSPDDNSSLLSTSSLDSALNHSREEDELKAITYGDQQSDEITLREDIDKFFEQKGNCIRSEVTDSIGPIASITELTVEPRRNPRESQESGFVSMHSIRASMQSVTAKRLSTEQHRESIINSATVLGGKSLTVANMSIMNNSVQMTTSNTKTVSNFSNEISNNVSKTINNAVAKKSMITNKNENYVHMGSYDMLTFNADSLDGHDNHVIAMRMSNKKSIAEHRLQSNTSTSSTFELTDEDCIAEDDEVAPALPMKKRPSLIRRNRLSTYDNLDEPDDFQNHMMFIPMNHTKHQSLIEPRRFNHFGDGSDQPPPLPVKKKHMFQSVAYSVMAYMEMFGNCSHTTHNNSEFVRHSVHTCNLNHHSASVDQFSTSTTQHQNSRYISHSQTMSLSPLRRQVIMESSDSLASQASSLPPRICENPEYLPLSICENPEYIAPAILENRENLPPALPPKRVRTNTKLNNLNATPPSSPKLILSESVENSTPNNLSSQNINNNLNMNNNRNIGPKPTTNNIQPPISPSSNYVQISTSTINAAAAAEAAKQNNGIAKTEPFIKSNNGPMSNTNIVSDSNAVNNDVRVIYTNLNILNSTNNRSSDENHYNQLCDQSADDRKPNSIAKIDSDTNNKITATTDNDKCSTKQNSSQTNNNNNNSINDKNADEDVVELRRRPASSVTSNSSLKIDSGNGSPSKSDQINLIEEIDVQKYLVFKKDGEDGPDVKGGELNALIVHASKVQKVSENAFGEAFITTFRTFITPLDLIEKLTHRYSLFCCQINETKQKAAKESFSLLVRVVNDLTAPDLSPHILQLLNEFVYQLVCSGQLMMAKLLRNNILEKIMVFKQQKWSPHNPVLSVTTSLPSLLDLKSTEVAEQMTLLDAQLFQKIEIPEVLLWAQEQCEERSPNLTRFTEHFNKMSYWARSQILLQTDSKDREKYVMRFIKIMKHLRKINNYNSYLALLSALDSAPIRRLEWHKTITEGLKEYCALIDSSLSFRAYRQALAETNPPCIPYIGLILQDLTFVHIGNPDYLNTNVINFSKRWQQHNIVVNMKRFKKHSSYPFKKNPKIVEFFENFENYLDEDAMWQLSETIKPRVSRKPISQPTN